MNRAKLAESIKVFKQYYLLDREFYDEDERGWKVELCERFQEVFAHDNVTGESFFDSLRALFENSRAAQTMVWLLWRCLLPTSTLSGLVAVRTQSGVAVRAFL